MPPGGVEPQRGHDPVDLGQVGHPERDLVGWRRSRTSRRTRPAGRATRRPSAASSVARSRNATAAEMPSLSRTVSGFTGSRAPPRSRKSAAPVARGDPLEAGERVRVSRVGSARRRSQSAGDETIEHASERRRVAGLGRLARGAPAEQRADLVAAEAPPAAVAARRGWRRRAGRHPDRWRSRGPRRPPAAVAKARSIAPGSSGLGKATVGKRRIRVDLLGDDDGVGEARASSTPRERSPSRRRASPCRRRRRPRLATRRRDRGGRVDVLVDDDSRAIS